MRTEIAAELIFSNLVGSCAPFPCQKQRWQRIDWCRIFSSRPTDNIFSPIRNQWTRGLLHCVLQLNQKF